MGINIPVVLGGFGEDKKCLSDKTIAEIHSMEPKHVRERISQNIVRFKDGVDFIDLKQRVGQAGTFVDLKKGMRQAQTLKILQNLGYAKQSVTQADHIYMLSERGYAKLIKIMDSDLAWEIHGKLIDEYFVLREEKKEAKAHAERLASVNNAVKILTPMLEKAVMARGNDSLGHRRKIS